MILCKFGLVMEYLVLSIYDNKRYTALAGKCCSLRVCMTSAQDLPAFIVSGEKSDIILIGLSLHVTWSFSFAAFNILSLFCAFGVFIIMWLEEFLFWSCIFGVLHVSCMFMGRYFSRFRKFSSIILLRILTGPLSWESSLSSIPFLLSFVFSLFPGFPGCFVLEGWVFLFFFCFLHVLWLLCQCFLVYLLHPRVSLPSLVFCWWCLLLWLLISFLVFLSLRLSPVIVSL